MKHLYILFICLLHCCIATSQTCDTYIVLNADGTVNNRLPEEDKIFHKASRKDAGEAPVILKMKSGLTSKGRQVIHISASKEGISSLGSGARIYMEFDDFTGFDHGNDSDADTCCEGVFLMSAGGYLVASNTESGKLRDCLKDKIISSLRLVYKDGSLKKELTLAQGEAIRNTFRCLLDE